jgi:hypothetical protein
MEREMFNAVLLSTATAIRISAECAVDAVIYSLWEVSSTQQTTELFKDFRPK